MYGVVDELAICITEKTVSDRGEGLRSTYKGEKNGGDEKITNDTSEYGQR